jgi:cytochrome b subunit of formate dehydrogenase
LFVPVIIILSIACALVAVTGFVLYVRYRMKENEVKERIFLRIHYVALSILLLLGIVYLFYMVETAG